MGHWETRKEWVEDDDVGGTMSIHDACRQFNQKPAWIWGQVASGELHLVTAASYKKPRLVTRSVMILLSKTGRRSDEDAFIESIATPHDNQRHWELQAAIERRQNADDLELYRQTGIVREPVQPRTPRDEATDHDILAAFKRDFGGRR